MRLAHVALLIILTGCGSSVSSTKTEWVHVALKIGKGEVSFPEKPRDRMVDEAHHRLTLERDNGKATLIAAVGTMPVEIDLSENDAPEFLDPTVNALSGQFLDSTVKSDTKGMLNNKYPFRDIVLELPGRGLFRARYILTEQELYQVIASGPKDYVEGDEAKKFIDSFTINAE
jgi:hypothetical protein